MKEIKIYDDEKNVSCSSCSAGTKKKSSRKKSWRFVLIIFALALIFALLGFVDLKSNAAELYYADYVLVATEHCDDGFKENMLISGSLSSSSPIYFYCFNIENPVSGRNDIVAYPVSRSNITGNANGTRTLVDKNGDTWYYCWAIGVTFDSPYPFSVEWRVRNADKVFKLNNFVNLDSFVSQFSNDTLDSTEVIDYNFLEVDSSLPLIEGVLANKISNKTGVNSGGHSVTSVKEYYDYVTWKNTGSYEIQIERFPIVKFYEGTFTPKFVQDFEGNFYLMDVLPADTSSFTYQVDLNYIETNYPDDYSFLTEVSSEVAGFWDTTVLYYGYRLRYVDATNNKASCWTYVVPEQSDSHWDYIEYPYYSYVEYVDGSLSDNSDATGSSGEYDSLEDIDNAKTELDNENAFKDKYDVISGDVGTTEATNWLYSVVNFVKSTPNVVGSVLGFLPTPIRSGVFVVIFLGVISSGLAIIRVLI